MGNIPNMGGPSNEEDKKKEEYKKKRQEQRMPTRVGRKKAKRGADTSAKLPTVFPSSKCRLRQLRLERIKDYMLLEEEFIKN